MIIAEGFDMVTYFRAVVGNEANRCGDCYRLRLSRTAQVARDQGYDSFSTTLLISPYQKHELIREVGQEVGKEHGVAFYYEDFRAGFRESHHLARELDLYHQAYCGCVYSEWERYAKLKIGED